MGRHRAGHGVPVSRVFWVLAAVATAAALAFLALPIAAIFLRVPPGEAYASPVARDALRLTVETSAVANAVFVAVGTPAAYVLAVRMGGHGGYVAGPVTVSTRPPLVCHSPSFRRVPACRTVTPSCAAARSSPWIGRPCA